MDNNDNIEEYKKKLDDINLKIEKNRKINWIFYSLIVLLLFVLFCGTIRGVEIGLFENTGKLDGYDGGILSVMIFLFFTWPIYLIVIILKIIKSCSNFKLKKQRLEIISDLEQYENNSNNIENEDIEVHVDYEKNNTKVEFVRCSKCKSKVLKGSKFCMKCGEHIK